MFSVIQASVDCVPNLLVMTDLWSIYSILLGPVGRFLPHAIQYILEKMYAILFCVVLLSFVWLILSGLCDKPETVVFFKVAFIEIILKHMMGKIDRLQIRTKCNGAYID